jgi:hypothetical protein
MMPCTEMVAARDIGIWHDPERPFRVMPGALRRYVETGDWVLLFNAIALAATPVQSE